ncbi:hypothetical protein ILUMI_26707 [Ignelater luminosus]|uniref:CRAL-TRIO domain-containing protein n=1 Tax=Ignelater luminosus TaxID=2038154 RepID=A0A8K0C9A9_IGNLU|nr:hypothetical protein ILUMI_26707 [Ignelater luminosus]
MSKTMPCEEEVISALDLGEPPQEILDYAKKELGEDPETRCQVLEEFRDLIYEKGECLPHRTDDAFLLRFLRMRYFTVKRAHKMLVNYYQFKEDNPEVFEDVDLNHLQKIGEADLISVPPYRDQNGRRILLYRLGLWDPEQFTITEIFQASWLILELAAIEQRHQILGGVVMFDLGGLTMQQVWHVTPKIVKLIFQIMVTSAPVRTHACHIINQPWIFEIVFNLFKPLLDERMTQRVFIHSDNMESLHQHMDPKNLPERYGGVHPDYNYNDWIEFFKGSEKILWELTTLGYNVEEKQDLDDEENEKVDS